MRTNIKHPSLGEPLKGLLSFDIPEEAHFLLKTECVKDRLSIKDFAYAMILKGLKEIKEEKFKKRLKESIQQSKEGMGRVISAAELDEMVKDAEEGKTTPLTQEDLDNWSKMVNNAKASLKQLNKQLSKKESETPISEDVKTPVEIQANIPRGERANFLKITITIPADMLSTLKNIGLKRKASGKKDTDTSALIREAVAAFISVNS